MPLKRPYPYPIPLPGAVLRLRNRAGVQSIPILRRDISQDPIGLAGGIKFYGYVEDSNDEIDSWGLSHYRRTKHVENRHVSRSKFSTKAKFQKPSQRRKLEARTMKKYDKKIVQEDGRILYQKDFARVIGTRNETVVRVVVDENKHKIITSFPAKIFK